jgi:uncharacterized membrane protein
MKNLKTWRRILLLTFIGYFANNAYLYFVIETQLTPLPSLVILIFKVTPLIIFIPWLLKPNYKASLFFCLLLMLYFAFSTMTMFESGTKAYIAIIDGLLLCVLFSAGFILGKLHKE